MHGLEFKQIKAACCCNSSNMSQNYTNKSAKLKMQSICTSLLSKTNSPVSLSWLQGYTPPRDAADICLALCLANDVPNSNLDTSYPDIWFHFYISHNQGSFAINSLLVMLWTLKSTWLSSKALSKWFIPQPKTPCHLPLPDHNLPSVHGAIAFVVSGALYDAWFT